MVVYSNPAYLTYHSGAALASPAGFRYGASAALTSSRREAVINLIAYVNALETPTLDMVSKENLDNVVWEWPVDDIPDQRTANSNGASSTNAHILAHVENAELDPAVERTRDVLGNYAHTQAQGFRVSDLQRNMMEYAVNDEYTLQGWRAYLKLATSFEYGLLWSTSSLGNGTSTARKMHGLFPWGIDCGSMANDAASVTIANHRVPGQYRGVHYTGTGNDITADEMYDEILIPWIDRGGNLDQAILMCGWGVKRILSSFAMTYQGSGATLTAAPRNERTIPAAARTVVDSIDVFETDLGPVYVCKHRYMSGTETRSLGNTGGAEAGFSNVKPASSLILVEPDYLRIGVVQGFYTKKLATVSLSSAAAVAGTLSLAVLNPKAIATAHNIAA